MLSHFAQELRAGWRCLDMSAARSQHAERKALLAVAASLGEDRRWLWKTGRLYTKDDTERKQVFKLLWVLLWFCFVIVICLSGSPGAMPAMMCCVVPVININHIQAF